MKKPDEVKKWQAERDAYIIKPTEPNALIVRIQEVISRCEQGIRLTAPERSNEEILLLKEYNEVLVRKLPPAAKERADLGDKIGAIKAYRQATGASLRIAKGAVESYMANNTSMN